MTKLVWNAFGERRYEAGVDRGVLYVDGLGVAWNGLTSVKESSSGGAPTPYYLDGVKYLNVASDDDYQATIDALSSPPEFDRCDGTVGIQNGLFITQQKRKAFAFSYRTLMGNDSEGLDFGYKLHLVYNALAAPTARDNSSLSDSVTVNSLSWSVTTTPPRISGYTPSAHLVVDSTQTPPLILAMLEGTLYGTGDTSARMPDLTEVLSIFATVIDTIEFSEDDGSAPVDYPYVESPSVPLLNVGEEAIWLDTTSGTLNYVIGD